MLRGFGEGLGLWVWGLGSSVEGIWGGFRVVGLGFRVFRQVSAGLEELIDGEEARTKLAVRNWQMVMTTALVTRRKVMASVMLKMYGGR